MSNEDFTIRDMRAGAATPQPIDPPVEIEVESPPQVQGVQSPEVSKEIDSFLCECGRSFPTQVGLTVHKRSHNIRRERCPECNELYTPGPGMTRHRQMSHGVPLKVANGGKKSGYKGKRKKCLECGVELSAKDMARHVRTQHPQTVEVAPTPAPTPPKRRQDWDVDDIFNAVVSLMWPKGEIPVDAFLPLIHWREATAKMLVEVTT